MNNQYPAQQQQFQQNQQQQQPTENLYAGSIKTKSNQYGAYLHGGFSQEDLQKLLANVSESGWVNFSISARKEVSQHGHSHSLKIMPPQAPQQTQGFTPQQAPQQAQPAQQPQGFSQPAPQQVQQFQQAQNPQFQQPVNNPIPHVDQQGFAPQPAQQQPNPTATFADIPASGNGVADDIPY